MKNSDIYWWMASLMMIVLAGCYSTHHAVAATDSPDSYHLVWADEFNTDGPPNINDWNYETGFVRNEEYQWYQPQNAWCENGLLIIEARRESKPNPHYVAGSTNWKTNRDSSYYTSSSINTSGKHSWQYGRFEMRGRININSGLWPAWWTLGTSRRWPANGEIDIMEYYRNRLLANIAHLGSNGKAAWYSNTFPIDSLGGQQWASQFHTWRMDWDQHKIALFVDGHLLNELSLDELVNKDGSDFNPFKQPHYMLLDLAIGGANGGDPAATTFPNRFEVDYVRVYQR